jgi:hypothetical protein
LLDPSVELHMNTHHGWQRRASWLTGIATLMASGSCSVFYDFSTQQCNTTSDCLKMGAEFTNTECRSHVCVAKAGKGGGSGVGGQTTTILETGGTSSYGGADGSGGTSTATGGAPEVGGAAGAAGDSGAGGQPTCSNQKCMTDHNSMDWICRNNACVQLTTTECPVLIPKATAPELLKKPGVIVVGGYAQMANKSNLYDSQAIINWDLVFSDFNEATFGGLPGYGSGSDQRPLVALVCNTAGATDATITTSVQHLTQTVQVPAILSTLSSNYLYRAWQTLYPDGPSAATAAAPVFFMSTGSADLRLANLTDDDLMWHMLGDPRALAALGPSG